MAGMTGAAKTMKYLMLPGEKLTDIKKQWDQLTDDDKAELVESAKVCGIA